MTPNELLERLDKEAESVAFSDVITTIDEHYNFTPTAFKNGDTANEANQNNGSCKIFAFAKLQGIKEEKTLQLFGDYYRVDVLQNPEATDHQNIRQFIVHGWSGVIFEGEALSSK